MFTKYKFKSRGIGLVSTKKISKDIYVGDYFTKFESITTESRFIYDGWIETNPLGRYLNHNKKPNCKLILDGDTIRIFTDTNINEYEELTINYMKVIQLIKLPESLIEKYSIIDYDYIDEEISTNKSLI